jgi:glycosyltransferase involved in cell wall biosynthesis
MKLSICMTYYNRRDLLINTLDSIRKYKKDHDLEVLIVDDASNDDNRIEDLENEYSDLNLQLFRFEPSEKWWTLQILPHNKLIAMASGDVIIQQGAECYHATDVITDALENTKDNEYRVYGCYSLTEIDTTNIQNPDYQIVINNECNWNTIYEKGGWYQHSKYRNGQLNFCTSITKKDLYELGGFDERFSMGIGYGDNEFITRIKRKNMNVLSLDDLYVYHQYHEPTKYDRFDPNVQLFQVMMGEETIKVHNTFLS